MVPAAGFILLILLISVNVFLLKKKGIQVRSVETKESDRSKWIILFFAAFLLLFLSEIATPFIGFSLLPKALAKILLDAVILRLTGAFTVFISVLMMKTTLKHFSGSLRFGLNENKTGKLVTSGIFSLSRNPFFLSLLLFFTGTVLVFPNFFFLVYTIAAYVGIHLAILKEEKFMTKVYGEKYRNYAARVRRYF